MQLTFDTGFDCGLDGRFKNCSVLPNVHHTLEFRLELSGGTLVRDRHSFRDDWSECYNKVILMTDLGLLGHLY